MRLGLPLLRRERRAFPGRRARLDRREPQLRPLRPARPDARRDAVELPLLAGLPLRRAGAHGRKRRPPQACFERPRLRPRDRGDLPRRGFSRRRLPDAPRRLGPGGAPDRRSAHRGRDAHRQRGRGSLRRTERGCADQEGGARARRQRPLHRDAERRSRNRRLDGREGADRQQRSVLHRRQALHRPPGRRRRLREALRREDARAEGRRPDGSLRRDRARSPRPRSATKSTAWSGAPSPPARGSPSAASPRDGPGNFYPPTVLADVPTGSPADVEEIFGPVASLFRVGSIDEAIVGGQPHALRPRLLGLDARPRRARALRSASSRPARSSSTAWSRAIRGCPSAA